MRRARGRGSTPSASATGYFHAAGLSRLVYFNPSLCLSYREVYDRAAAAGVLQSAPGERALQLPGVRRRLRARSGFTEEPLAQFDWTAPATEDFYAELVDEAVGLGADGWMEDFGEGTPTTGVLLADGTSGDAAHNRYPTDYHCAMQRIASRFDRPLVRFQRSGWTGSARCAEVVWGGDPTTVWGFDGLSSVVTQALSIGLSRGRPLGHRHRRLRLLRRRPAEARRRPRTRRSPTSSSPGGWRSAHCCR